MINDLDGNRILSAYIGMESNEVKTFIIAIEAESGYSLSGEAVGDLTVEAREEGVGGWVDIETTSIDLTPWDATTQNFEIRITSGTITSQIRRSFSLWVALT